MVEAEFGAALDSTHAFLTSSGKAALITALRALSRIAPERRQVVVPAYTCFSLPAAVARAGMIAVPVDVDPSTLDLDQEALRRAVSPATLCVIQVHLFGRPADTAAIGEVCREQEVFHIEDAAQALGTTHDGKMLGTRGDIGIFSFGRGKTVTCGAGGAVVTQSGRVGALLRDEVVHLRAPAWHHETAALVSVGLMALFIRPALYWFPASLPFLGLGETVYDTEFPIARLSGMRAGLLGRWRRNLERGNAARQENVAWYSQRVRCAVASGDDAPLLRFPVLLATAGQKDRALDASRRMGLGISGMYPAAIDELSQVRAALGRRVECAQARDIARRLVTLPTHQHVRPKDRERIVGALCS
ncbi:MAG TPA: DegT/DnrJ/EryC1/StrS family aminotransferase [bacterium]